MAAALFFLAPLIEPYLTRSLTYRALGLFALVGGGGAVYAIACFVTGAFVTDDLKTLLRRRAKEA